MTQLPDNERTSRELITEYDWLRDPYLRRWQIIWELADRLEYQHPEDGPQWKKGAPNLSAIGNALGVSREHVREVLRKRSEHTGITPHTSSGIDHRTSEETP